jgi:hypothetical protein
MAISDWDQRQLCPDGTCVGLIGPDGTCRVCGRVAPDWGDERRRGLVAAEEDERGEGGERDEDDEDDDQDEISPSAPALLGEAVEWHRRRLCVDGACIGVIGPDGRCKICGKPADEDADEEDYGENDSLAFPEESDLHSRDEIDDDEEDDDEEDDDEEPEITISHGDAEPHIVIVRDGAATGGGDGGDAGDDRKLCPDGACIGVIGPDGRCKICGKEAA